MNNKGLVKLSMILMTLSAILIIMAFMYYSLEDEVINYRYSDNEEYGTINEGLNLINTLPIELNIINKYFGNMNNLSQEEKEQIVLSYAIKNKMYTECGTSYCISEDILNSNELLKIFNLDLTFQSKNINVYIDDYGTNRVYKVNNNYQIDLDLTDNKNYTLYTKFDHFKQDGDSYYFYLYQGYYNSNCTKGEELELFDFMTGESVYKDTCNGNNEFTQDPGDNIEKLQKYKYELRKNKNNEFYLYGYNPVKSYE